MKKTQITAQLLLADVRGLGIFPNKQFCICVHTDALLAKDKKAMLAVSKMMKSDI